VFLVESPAAFPLLGGDGPAIDRSGRNPQQAMAASIAKSTFGTLPDGTAVELFTLSNAAGLVCRATTYGAVITELHVPDRAGRLGDIVLGFDNLGQYVRQNSPYLGAVIGRVANRIAGARFTVDGKAYRLAANNGANTLHGGIRGFDKVVWLASASESAEGPSVLFSHTSPDGDEGFPGNLRAKVRYTLTNRDELRIDYEAETDKATPVNLTNHSYFNLACTCDIQGHALRLNARTYTVPDAAGIPTGAIESVAGGPLDFTAEKPVGRDLGKAPGGFGGFDHNFVIDGGGGAIVSAARLREPASGRVMEVLTDQPAVQFYTGNNLDGTLVGKRGARYTRHAALCLETQHYPDSVNHPSFPTTLLRPGETFRSTTIHRFSAA
jgi:aldose 1-epimerase